jgi:hypothetical protein
MTLYDLTNAINEPTRMGALLDPVIVSNIDIVVDSEVIFLSHKYLEKYTREPHPQNCFYLF